MAPTALRVLGRADRQTLAQQVFGIVRPMLRLRELHPKRASDKIRPVSKATSVDRFGALQRRPTLVQQSLRQLRWPRWRRQGGAAASAAATTAPTPRAPARRRGARRGARPCRRQRAPQSGGRSGQGRGRVRQGVAQILRRTPIKTSVGNKSRCVFLKYSATLTQG